MVFLALVPKWLSGKLWEAILACYRLWCPNGSQRDSGSLFWLVLSSGDQMALRQALGSNFSLFWALVAKWLWETLWGAILACSGFGVQIAFREALGYNFSLFWTLLDLDVWESILLVYYKLWVPNGSQRDSGRPLACSEFWKANGSQRVSGRAFHRPWDAILDCSGLCWTDGSHRGLHHIRLDWLHGLCWNL